ncbi:hypothetical protein JCM10908_001736 [Rhodotorula pacifica]|uniref:uncharacterized protein n=1 Tax=Rhodotorula pacifica TaxID=1495444 RepID=UPI003179EE27
MDESPWGAPDDSMPASLPRPPSPKMNNSPPTSSFSLSTPSWGGEDDAWGGGSSTYIPPAPSASRFGGTGGYGAPAEDPPPSLFAAYSADREIAWPNQDDASLSYGVMAGSRSAADELEPYGTSASPPLRATDNFAPSHDYASTDTYRPPPDAESASPTPEETEDRGWGGASPDLPPISSLRLASPPSPIVDERAAGWTPEESDDFDVEPPPPPLPTVEEVFASAKPRRESVELKKAAEGGGDAWGSSQGWEERMRAEAEARALERGDEPEPEKKEGEGAGADPAPTHTSEEAPRAAGGLSSILGKFRKGAEDTAAKSTEVAKDVAGAASRTAGQLAQTASDAVSQAQQSQANNSEAKAPATKSSWFGRKPKQAEEPAPIAAPAPKKPVESQEDDPYTLGVEEVETGGSGRATAEEPPQATAIGRFFSRLKRAPSSNPDDDSDKAVSPRASAEIAGSIRPDDLDVLANGGLGPTARTSTSGYQEDEFDPQPSRTGLFGSRSRASAAQVPMAPPEDDFGGLIGALASAPTRPVQRSSGSKAFDPFDPLSDSFGAVPAIPALNKTKSAPPTRAVSTSGPMHRPAVPLSPPPRSASARPAAQTSPHRAPPAVASFRPHASTSSGNSSPATAAQQQDDDFDNFFNAATAQPNGSTRTGSQAPGSFGNQPAPRSAQPVSTLLPSVAAGASAGRPRPAAPAPRMTISPPARNSTASPASSIGSASGRATTPILPLPPPPPPSQPIAGSQRGLNILAPPPPPPSSGVLSSSSTSPALPSPTLAAPASTKPRLPPPLTATAISRSTSPLVPSPTLSQGSKPLTPSATQQRTPSSGPLSMDDLSFFEA